MKRLTYWESVSIGWRILWQAIGGFVLALFLSSMAVLTLLPELTRTGPSYWALVVPLVIAFVFSLFVMLPLVVRGLINASFGTFRLVVIRKEPCHSTI
jgi:FtsH-binding integral membrane protein